MSSVCEADAVNYCQQMVKVGHKRKSMFLMCSEKVRATDNDCVSIKIDISFQVKIVFIYLYKYLYYI